MSHEGNSATVLRNLANDLLTADENEAFKNALQAYRNSRSLTSLVMHLTHSVTSTEKLMLLIELGRILPEHIRADFHKLCCLHFPMYSSFLTYFNPNTFSERNRVISKDTSGHFQVISTGLDQNLFMHVNPTDQRSLQGESGIDVNSDVDDISRHGGEVNGGNLGSSWKIENRSLRSSSMSSYHRNANGVVVTSPAATPKGSVSSAGQIMKQSHSSLPQEQGGGIRNRARSLRILSGSLPSVLAAQEHPPAVTKGEDRVRILLKRRKDGSLGVGVRGGKEYNSPIEVCQVEPGSQGHMQGLRVGDRILDVNGTDFANITHTDAVMLMRNAWNIIMIVQHQKEDVAPDGGLSHRSNASFDDMDVMVYPTKKGKLGCGVYRDNINNLVVKNVEKNSPASKAGIHKGDRLLEIDGLKVTSLTDKQVSTMTNVKRVRMRVQRPTMSVGTQDTSGHMDFNDIFSTFALDFSQPGHGDSKDDDDCATFASSTPRKAIRSQSEERRPPSVDLDSMDTRPRSASQARSLNPTGSTNEKKASKSGQRPLPPTPQMPQTPPKTRPDQKHQQKNMTSHGPMMSHGHSHTRGNNMTRTSTSPIESDSIDDNYIMSSQSSQQRIYKPRLMGGSKYSSSSSSYSPSIQHKSNLSKPSKPLGRYISKSDQPTLPSRMAMMYMPKQSKADVEHERSRPRKRTILSTSSKMKELRNRSQSPHSAGVNPHDRRSGSMPARRDREFLKAIQSSVERRQRAQRLSLYQLPDQDDDAWLIF